jgi:hypothetical protein
MISSNRFINNSYQNNTKIKNLTFLTFLTFLCIRLKKTIEFK